MQFCVTIYWHINNLYTVGPLGSGLVQATGFSRTSHQPKEDLITRMQLCVEQVAGNHKVVVKGAKQCWNRREEVCYTLC